MKRKYKVIIRADNTSRYLSDSDNRDYITSIESISVVDKSHALILILKASTLLKRWFVNEFTTNTILSYSESGYLNDDINLK